MESVSGLVHRTPYASPRLHVKQLVEHSGYYQWSPVQQHAFEEYPRHALCFFGKMLLQRSDVMETGYVVCYQAAILFSL